MEVFFLNNWKRLLIELRLLVKKVLMYKIPHHQKILTGSAKKFYTLMSENNLLT